jgi:hypothetical protein
MVAELIKELVNPAVWFLAFICWSWNSGKIETPLFLGVATAILGINYTGNRIQAFITNRANRGCASVSKGRK